MRYESELYGGRLIRRYKRFLADIELDSGKVITAHCSNTGSLYGLTNEGRRVYVMRKPFTKLGYSWELAEDGVLVGVNTALPNKMVKEAIEEGLIRELAGYNSIETERKYGENSRVDLLLRGEAGVCYVEVKTVHMVRESGVAEFPDAVTARGTKHLRELSEVVRQGARACMVYVIQRSDCSKFGIAGDIDVEYGKNLRLAIDAGVEVYGYGCKYTMEEFKIASRIEFIGVLG